MSDGYIGESNINNIKKEKDDEYKGEKKEVNQDQQMIETGKNEEEKNNEHKGVIKEVNQEQQNNVENEIKKEEEDQNIAKTKDEEEKKKKK